MRERFDSDYAVYKYITEKDKEARGKVGKLWDDILDASKTNIMVNRMVNEYHRGNSSLESLMAETVFILCDQIECMSEQIFELKLRQPIIVKSKDGDVSFSAEERLSSKSGKVNPGTLGKHTEFGNELRRLRQEARVTYREIAKKTNKSIGYLCDIERGRRKPPLDKTLTLLIEVLGDKEGKLADLAVKEGTIGV